MAFPSPPPPGRAWRLPPHRGALAALALLSLLTVGFFFHPQSQVKNPDVAIYLYMGEALARGQQLYTDLIDNKPPGIYALYLAAVKTLGYRESTPRVVGVLVTLLALLAAYACLMRWFRDGPLVAAGLVMTFFALHSYRMAAFQLNTELVINVLLWIALYGLARPAEGRGLWLAGFALGLATVFKTNAFLILGTVLLAWLAAARWAMLSKAGWGWWTGLAGLLLPSLMLWFGVSVYFLATGRLQPMYQVVVLFGHTYAGSVLKNLAYVVTHPPSILWQSFLADVWVLFPLAAVGIYHQVRQKVFYPLACFLGALAMIGSGNAIKAYYYSVLFPSLILLSVAGLFFIREALSRAVKARSGLLVTGMVLFILAAPAWAFMQNLAAAAHEAPPLSWHLGKLVRSLTTPEESIFQWGLAGELYAYSQRRAASAAIMDHVFYFTPPSIREPLKRKTMENLARHPPALVVFSSWDGKLEDHFLLPWLQKNYHLLGAFDQALLFERNGRHFTPSSAVLTNPVAHPWKHVRYEPLGPGWKPALTRDGLGNWILKREPIVPQDQSRYARLVQEGLAAGQRQAWEQTRRLWAEASRLDPKRVEAHANLGLLHEMDGAMCLALREYENAANAFGAPWDQYYQEAREMLRLRALQTMDPVAAAVLSR